MTMMLHNYRSRQFHRASNGINPSGGFRDIGSPKSSPSAAWLNKFLAHGQAHMGQITVTLHSCRSRQVHETLNRVNPSSSLKDMRSAKSGPNLWQICGKFLARGQAHMGQMGKWPWQCATTGLDNPTELRMEKIHQAVRDMGSASLAAARPNAQRPPARPDGDDNTPPARRAEG